MRIIVDVNHPANVHYYKNLVKELRNRGHVVLITASSKDVSLRLLQSLGLEYEPVGNYGGTLISKVMNFLIVNYKMLKVSKKFNPDLFIGHGSIRAAQVSSILSKPCIITEDTEHAWVEHCLYKPFADVILTPSSFRKNMGNKQETLNGTMDLLYLHPQRFKPNPSVLKELGLSENEPFIVVRFTSWEAVHDIGQSGIRNRDVLIKELEKSHRVILSTECSGHESRGVLKIPPEKFHDLLYYATLYIGEGGTTASEAATIGTHSIHISSAANKCGVFEQFEHHELMWIVESDEAALSKAREILSREDVWNHGKTKAKEMLKSSEDLTSVLLQYVENFNKK